MSQLPDLGAPMDRHAPVGPVDPLTMGEGEYFNWLQNCGRGIGGSAAAALLGMHPQSTPRDVWKRILGQERQEAPSPDAMRGIYLEDDAAAWFISQEQPGMLSFFYPGGYHRHAERPYLVGNPDGIMSHMTRGMGVWECKVPNDENRQQQIESGVKPHHVVQVNHYMNLDDTYRFAQFCLFDPMSWTAHTPITERNAELIQAIEEAAHVFWYTHIIPRVPPADAQAIVAGVSIPTVGDTATRVTAADDLRIIDRFVQAHRQAKLAEHALAPAKEAMRSLMERLGTDFAIDGNGVKIYYRAQTKREIDVGLLRERYPEVAAAVERVREERPLKAFYRG